MRAKRRAFENCSLLAESAGRGAFLIEGNYRYFLLTILQLDLLSKMYLPLLFSLHSPQLVEQGWEQRESR